MSNKRFTAVLAVMLMLVMLALYLPFALRAQNGAVYGPLPIAVSRLHGVGGLYIAPAYATWQGYVLIGNNSTGAGQSITIYPGPGNVECLADQTCLPLAIFYNVNVPILINDANFETITPTAVSIGTCPAGNIGVGGSAQCATITATIANVHGQGAPAVSGDNGIMEAVTDAGNNGGGLVYWQANTGIVTLNTGGVTTTTTTKVPTVYISMGGAGRVTTTVTTSTAWAVGAAGGTTDFCTAQTTMIAGTVCNVVALSSPTSRGTGAVALTSILFTMTGTPGAGAIKAQVWGYTPVQPAS